MIHFLNFVFSDVFCQYNNAYNPYQQGYGGQGYVAQWPPRRPNQNQNYQYNQYYNQYGQNNRYPAYNQGSKEWVQTGVRWLRPEEAASARAGPVRNQYAPPVTRPEYNQYRPQYRPQYSRPDYNQQNYYTTYDGRRVDTSYLAPVSILSGSFTFLKIDQRRIISCEDMTNLKFRVPVLSLIRLNHLLKRIVIRNFCTENIS